MLVTISLVWITSKQFLGKNAKVTFSNCIQSRLCFFQVWSLNHCSYVVNELFNNNFLSTHFHTLNFIPLYALSFHMYGKSCWSFVVQKKHFWGFTVKRCCSVLLDDWSRWGLVLKRWGGKQPWRGSKHLFGHKPRLQKPQHPTHKAESVSCLKLVHEFDSAEGVLWLHNQSVWSHL